MQIGMGFWALKTVLAAVTFNLFSLLAQRPQSATEIKKKLGIHQRSLYDFIDALVAL